MSEDPDRLALRAAWADIEHRDGAEVRECRGVPCYTLEQNRLANVLLFRGMDALGAIVEVYVTTSGLLVEANGVQCWPPEDVA